MRDERALRQVRPIAIREMANLHGSPTAYQFLGPLNECYDMVIDSVMARAIGLAVADYFAAIPYLAEAPHSLGYCEVLSLRERIHLRKGVSLWHPRKHTREPCSKTIPYHCYLVISLLNPSLY